MLQPCQLNLWKAAETGDVTALRRALDQGAVVASRNRLGWNALHRVWMVDNVEALQLVLKAGETELERAELPATGSSQEKRPPLIATEDAEGNSPLHVAAGCGHVAMVNALLQAGADVGAKKKYGGTPMHTCCQALADATAPELVQRLQDVVMVLLSAGGLLEAEDEHGKPAVLALSKEQRQVLLTRILSASAPSADSGGDGS